MEIVDKRPIKRDDGGPGSHLVLKCGCELVTDTSYQRWTIYCPQCEGSHRSTKVASPITASR